ncbi:MAG: V-type ATPase 116kDa subunit family protein [Planctomycetaceae bacterium]|nr:hypothetical protein [Planctomycetaceae bacterium]
MIVTMQKVYVAVAAGDRGRLLDGLADLGVMHLQPVDPSLVKVDEPTARARDAARRAMQILASVESAGPRPSIAPAQAVDEVMELSRRSAEQISRLAALHRQIEQLEPWGDVRLEQLQALASAGVPLRFFDVPREAIDQVRAELVQEVATLPREHALVAAVDRAGALQIPEAAVELPLPARDRPSIRAEAAHLDATIKADAARLAQLAGLADDIRHHLGQLEERAAFMQADTGSLVSGPLFAVQGWMPANDVARLTQQLADSGITAAVAAMDAADDETPPTLVRPPRWAKPIQGLMTMLGLDPGYRETDVSVAFMIALPIFAAILIGDAGYGLLFLLAPVLLYRKTVAKMGRDMTHLIMIIGVTTMIWGCLTSSFFGINFLKLLTGRGALIEVSMGSEAMRFMMLLSFTIGVLHLSLAQLWRAALIFPSLQFLCKVGWAIFLWGMYGVVRMVVLQAPFNTGTPWPYLLIAGGALAIIFTSPSRNIFRMVLVGLANFPLAGIGTFSDIMSYVRLMAIGLAGAVLASNFNELGTSAGPIFLIPIVLFGHALNIGLAMIALFAHGVRLNVLEFSNNFGMEWSGHPYRPFERTSQ